MLTRFLVQLSQGLLVLQIDGAELRLRSDQRRLVRGPDSVLFAGSQIQARVEESKQNGQDVRPLPIPDQDADSCHRAARYFQK